ncbi:phosphotransferase [Streptomyces sp. NBC_00237]|uniref:phosphotransferase family protein n=1 Tax=Streptomyces sp. NBC_00237 TaxID=2975687 RepID=UPI00224E3847|nr:phosphotransferase [Streptomyces sp. NBC_00237]MCX5207550.1 phosphotransferase [Streptomyces sp. NBC_00237]
MEIEVPLPGGRITPGVVRVGGTVRRPRTASSPFVAELLDHLRQEGFTGAPRHFGFDAAGREVLSYIPGWVPARFQRWTDAQVAASGSLLRAFHDATRGSRLAGGHPVVCHHDPGPNNAVFTEGVPVAFIDFDTAAPGDPLEDLGYMAWTFCISSKPGAPPAAVQAAQVRVLADAYLLDTCARPRLIGAALDRQTRNAHWWRSRLAGPPPHVADDHEIVERIRWSEREHTYTAANRAVFEAALA